MQENFYSVHQQVDFLHRPALVIADLVHDSLLTSGQSRSFRHRRDVARVGTDNELATGHGVRLDVMSIQNVGILAGTD